MVNSFIDPIGSTMSDEGFCLGMAWKDRSLEEQLWQEDSDSRKRSNYLLLTGKGLFEEGIVLTALKEQFR